MAHKEEHLAELLKLAPDERLEVANALLDSLDDESAAADWENAWAAELTRRLEGLQSGERRTISADEVFAEARERFPTGS